MSIRETIESIQPRRIDLTDATEDPHRPELKVWAGFNDDADSAYVTLGIMSLWGQQTRFVDLDPDEARKLARILIETANAVNHVANGVARNTTELMQQLRDCPENAGCVP